MKALNWWQQVKYVYDWRSIIKTVALLSLIIILFFYIFNRSYFEMKMGASDKTGITNGFIINRVEKSGFRETTTAGNQIYTDVIDCFFTYKVKNIVYYNHQSISYSVIIAQ